MLATALLGMDAFQHAQAPPAYALNAQYSHAAGYGRGYVAEATHLAEGQRIAAAHVCRAEGGRARVVPSVFCVPNHP